MSETTLVSTSRLKDFELFYDRIGSTIPSYSAEPPAGTLRISVPNTEVSKTEWAALYEKSVAKTVARLIPLSFLIKKRKGTWNTIW